MTRVFQLTDSSEGYLARLYRFLWPHVIGCLQSPNLRGMRSFKFTKGKFLQMVTAAMKLKGAYSLEEKL